MRRCTDGVSCAWSACTPEVPQGTRAHWKRIVGIVCHHRCQCYCCCGWRGGRRDRALRLWDVASGRVKHTFTGHSDKVRALASACGPTASPDGWAESALCCVDGQAAVNQHDPRHSFLLRGRLCRYVLWPSTRWTRRARRALPTTGASRCAQASSQPHPAFL